MILMSLFIGCNAHDVAEETPGTEPEIPSFSEAQPEPTWDAAQVASTLELALGHLPEPKLVVGAYLELMSLGDENCPGDAYQILDDFVSGCTSDNGYFYSGVTNFEFGESEWKGDLFDYEALVGDFWIDTPDGERLEGGGHATWAWNTHHTHIDIQGTWLWSGSETGWLSDGFSGDFVAKYFTGEGIELNGAIDVSGVYVAMSDFYLVASCGWGPEGLLQLRDPAGGWYSLQLSFCDPCGMVQFNGTDLGEACLDLSAVVANFEEKEQ